MKTRFWLWLWWYARQRAIQRVRDEFNGEYNDAIRAWDHDAHLGGILAPGQHTFPTAGLGNDLALHDAADHLLGKP